MENQDKIFDQIKSAAHHAESKEFPSMDKVWSRLEDKLDHKVLKKKSNQWKKIAVVASILLVISIGYQFLEFDKNTVVPQKEVIVNEDSNEIVTPVPKTEEYIFTPTETKDPLTKEKATIILEKQIKEQQTVASTLSKNDSMSSMKTKSPLLMKKLLESRPNAPREKMDRNSGYFLRSEVYQAIGVTHDEEKAKSAEQVQSPAPLVVIDGKAITKDQNAKYGNSEDEMLSEMEKEEIESISVLKEPLYIINGVYYKEQDLFGANPTSPYAPLNQQKIEKIEILQEKEAIAKYGDQGKKGVVIITTKNGKPAVLTPKK
jgi:hypothetical protein